MNLRAPPVLRPDEFPEAEPKLLETLTRGFRDVYNALAAVPDRSVASGSFMSAASGVTTVTVKNPLGKAPQHHSLALRRDDNADFSAAWSHWLIAGREGLQLKFVGLPASTRHVFSVEFF